MKTRLARLRHLTLSLRGDDLKNFYECCEFFTSVIKPLQWVFTIPLIATCNIPFREHFA